MIDWSLLKDKSPREVSTGQIGDPDGRSREPFGVLGSSKDANGEDLGLEASLGDFRMDVCGRLENLGVEADGRLEDIGVVTGVRFEGLGVETGGHLADLGVENLGVEGDGRLEDLGVEVSGRLEDVTGVEVTGNFEDLVIGSLEDF